MCMQGSGEVYMYQPHTRAVSGLVFPSSTCTTSLFSTSYDGILRHADLVKGVFEEVNCACVGNILHIAFLVFVDTCVMCIL